MNQLLEVKDLVKTFIARQAGLAQSQTVLALDRVSFAVSPGEHLSVVGGSGCGKTTLAKVVMGLLRPDSGTICFRGQAVGQGACGLRDFRRQARMIFQDPFSSLDPRFTVRAILREALCLEEKQKGRPENRMREVLRAVDLEGDILVRYPHEFSGGERQRIAIARALMTDPALLILDEAVSSVDVLVQKNILDLLERLQAQLPVTYIFISHNLRVVRKISHKIAVMYQGRIVEYGTARDIFDSPSHNYTKQLLRAALEYRCDERRDVVLPPGGVLKDIGNGHLVLSGEQTEGEK